MKMTNEENYCENEDGKMLSLILSKQREIVKDMVDNKNRLLKSDNFFINGKFYDLKIEVKEHIDIVVEQEVK